MLLKWCFMSVRISSIESFRMPHIELNYISQNENFPNPVIPSSTRHHPSPLAPRWPAFQIRIRNLEATEFTAVLNPFQSSNTVLDMTSNRHCSLAEIFRALSTLIMLNTVTKVTVTKVTGSFTHPLPANRENKREISHRYSNINNYCKNLDRPATRNSRKDKKWILHLGAAWWVGWLFRRFVFNHMVFKMQSLTFKHIEKTQDDASSRNSTKAKNSFTDSASWSSMVGWLVV